MRRWLAILLLVFLPLQQSWAVVASYCAHEADAGSGHFGHHVHDGHGHAVFGAADEDVADGASADASGFDAGHCHGHHPCIAHTLPIGAVLETACTPTTPGESAHSGHVPDAPERPQWAGLA